MPARGPSKYGQKDEKLAPIWGGLFLSHLPGAFVFGNHII